MLSGWITKYNPPPSSFDYFQERDSYVQVGDPVCQVLKERYVQAELEDVNS